MEEQTRAGIRARIAEYHWHHSIDLGGGLVTPGQKSLAQCQGEAAAVFDRVDVAGKSVLDIGAWNGFFSFEAKRRGAARVLATDSYCWAHAHFRGRETFDLARSAIGLEVEAQEIDCAELSPSLVGEFDVVLFLGVFYHRYDAIDALARAARLARHVLVVETVLDLRWIRRPAMAFYPKDELRGDASNWWGPNEHCVRELLLGHGFTVVEVARTPPAEYGRAIFHAWRSTELRRCELPKAQRLRPYNRLLYSKLVRGTTRPVRRWLARQAQGQGRA